MQHITSAKYYDGPWKDRKTYAEVFVLNLPRLTQVQLVFHTLS